MNSYFIERSKCPSCESSKYTVLCRLPYTDAALQKYLISFYTAQGSIDLKFLEGQDYVLVECLRCGLIFQQEIPSEFLMHKLYEEWIDPQVVFELVEKRRTVGYYMGLVADVISVIRQFNRPPMQLQFLDFGMGWGHWCRTAQAFGCTVYGTELSEARIEYAKQAGVRVINYEDISRLKFDFINTEQVFEHLPNPLETLVHLKQSLNTGGILKISVPNGEDIKHRLTKLDWNAPKDSAWSLNPIAPLEHINCFNRNALVDLARRCGLMPVKILSANLQLFPDGFQHQIKTILRLYRPRLQNVQRSSSIFFCLAN